MYHQVRYLFAGVFFGLTLTASVFLYRRLVRDVTELRALRVLGALSMIALVGGLFAVRTLLHGSPFTRDLAIGLAVWIGVLLYTLLALVLIDLVKAGLLLRRGRNNGSAPDGPASLERRRFMARAAAGGALLTGSGLSALAVFRAYEPPEEKVVQVKLPGLPKALEGFTIAQLSDLHIGPILQGRFVEELVERANAIKPDLVAITGDLVDGKTGELGRYVSRLTNLKAGRGVYFVSGNHDYYSGWEAWAAALPSLGVQVLRNRWLTIGDAGGSFDLIGVEDYGSRFDAKGYDLDAALAGRDPSRPSVLLSHQPGGFDDAIRRQVGLQLSGHTHGGQTFPITGMASLLWGARAHGLSREGSSQLFVSRGCGFVGPPMRLGSPPEMVKIVLLAG